MKQKTFIFSKKPKDLTQSPEVKSTRIRVGCGEGSLVFTLKNFIRVGGHDDTLPYQAKLYVNNTFLCLCFNDGWGGETVLSDKNEKNNLFTKCTEKVAQYKWKYIDSLIDLNIHFIADILACTANYYSQMDDKI